MNYKTLIIRIQKLEIRRKKTDLKQYINSLAINIYSSYSMIGKSLLAI